MKRYLSFLVPAILLILSCSGNDRQHVFTGIIEGTKVQVPALTGGKILNLLVDQGDELQAGQPVAQIDTVDLGFQKQQIEGALEEVEVQREIAQTNLNRAKENLQYVRKTFRRFQELLKKETVPQQRVDDLENQLEGAQSAYETALQQFQSIKAKRKQLDAQLKTVNKKITDARVQSPVSGVVTTKYYETGEAVPPLSPVVEVIDLNEVWVKIYVSETLLPRVKLGQKLRIAPDGSERDLQGTVSWISPEAEFTPKTILTPETRTSLVYAVKVTVSNTERILKQGMPVEVRM